MSDGKLPERQDVVMQENGVKLAEAVLNAMLQYNKDVRAQAPEVSEPKAMFFAAYFTLLAVGRSEAYRMVEEAKELKRPGLSMGDVIQGNVDLQIRGAQLLNSGFIRTFVEDFKMDETKFDDAMVAFAQQMAKAAAEFRARMSGTGGTQGGGNDPQGSGNPTWH